MSSRVSLIQRPTPLHRLDRLSSELQLDLWVKRDDLTGFAFGGNKGRKLERLIGAALEMGAETVVSCGSLQSNFIRQLGAACSRFGLRCVAATMSLPFSPPRPPVAGIGDAGGNVLLDEILGVDLRVFPDDTWETLYQHAEDLALEREERGEKVYRVPVGGSSPLGALAFREAGEELSHQSVRPFDAIVVASSSGSTQTGLTHWFHGTGTRVIGIACDPEPELPEEFAELAHHLDDLTGVRQSLKPEDFTFLLDYVGRGYGIPSEAGTVAIRRAARAEGLFLDPIYSGKAFAGLLALAESGELPGRVVFWHTGGLPALFATG